MFRSKKAFGRDLYQFLWRTVRNKGVPLILSSLALRSPTSMIEKRSPSLTPAMNLSNVSGDWMYPWCFRAFERPRLSRKTNTSRLNHRGSKYDLISVIKREAARRPPFLPFAINEGRKITSWLSIKTTTSFSRPSIV